MSEESAKISRATLSDVCRHTGLSTATVSRVINQTGNVKAATVKKVMDAIAQLGYVPNHAARALAGQRNKMIGVVFPEISTGFWAEILKGLDAEADDHQYHILTAFSHGGQDERELALRLLGEGRIDALVVMNLRLGKDFMQQAGRFNIPVILIDRPIAGLETASVTLDNVTGACQAMTHLYEHGYEQVVILAGDLETYDARQRLMGCKKAAKAAKVAWDDRLVAASSFTEEGGSRAIDTWFKQSVKPPRAIFCFNDNIAIGAMNALEKRGFAVPDDVAVIGFDDIDSARHLKLTTVHVPVLEMGRAAANAAIQVISNQAFNKQQVLPTQLVLRRSCGCLVEAEQKVCAG